MTSDPWQAKPAVRKNVPLIVGIEGPPGGGKTVSALLIAQGMQEVRGGPVIVLDTENRATKYAGVRVNGYKPFDFEIVNFDPPFRANRYLEAIRAQLPRNPAALIVDTMSDEHEGEGGRLEWHREELDNILRRQNIPVDDWGARERNSQSAYRPSSEARVKLVNGIARINTCPIIMNFRAREKTRPVEQERRARGGTKTVMVPTNIGFQPIAPAEIVHIVDIMCLLPARADGVPRWKSDKVHEDFIIKLPEQFRSLFEEGKSITPEVGKALAKWAAGEHVEQQQPKVALREQPKREGFARPQRDILAEARAKAREGYDTFNEWWRELPDADADRVLSIEDELRAIFDEAERSPQRDLLEGATA
jgi:hypothetical protein